jgi:hypothetical protein
VPAPGVEGGVKAGLMRFAGGEAVRSWSKLTCAIAFPSIGLGEYTGDAWDGRSGMAIWKSDQ